MKKIITLLSMALITISCFAQKSDTLKVDISKYHFIKIGDKVYKIVSTLEEVKPETIVPLSLWGGSVPYGGCGIFKFDSTYLLNNSIELAPYTIPNYNDGVYHQNEFYNSK